MADEDDGGARLFELVEDPIQHVSFGFGESGTRLIEHQHSALRLYATHDLKDLL
ncbi:hypothetical protein QWI29_04425 [Mycolicibacterium neoaurum]|uniref:hypothetical protein n=1 Tax=Mycolicibacterium neoaurum TaxID=1795 RepID=UPI002673E10C|nr:hypothetical protein [Mycolicibacterium neoaurum]MDO3399266.1 hypothetical protein [Mycolicibacterium neoaurum]